MPFRWVGKIKIKTLQQTFNPHHLIYKVACCMRLCVCVSVTLSLQPLVCDRQSVTVNHESQILITTICNGQSWEPNIEVLKPRSWEPGPKNQMQQHGSNRRRESRLLIELAWLLKLEMMVDVDTATQGFLGRYQYIKNLLKKRRKGY